MITFEGQPAANALIKIQVYWKDDIGEEALFGTNADGTFRIPVKKRRVRIPLFAELVVTQHMAVTHNEREYTVWSKASIETDEYGGLDRKTWDAQCELTLPRVKQEIFNGLFSTSCKFDPVK